MHAPGYAITAEKDAVLGEDLSSLLHTVPGRPLPKFNCTKNELGGMH
jgi:hypothetical protein